jgi:hypothetical protein
MRKPGFVSPLSLIASAVVVLAVGIVTWLAGGILFSPGRLSAQAPAHQSLKGATSHADLSGNCSACHPAPWANDRMSDRCLTCHVDVKTQLASNTGLHGVVSTSDDDCRECHKDHRGAAGILTEFQGDAALHERTRFSLAQHTKQADGSRFECAACHPSGYARFDQAVCTDCHAKLDAAFMSQHQADYGADCLGCHDGKTKLAAFDHNQTRLPLDGKHAGLQCRACHAARPQLTGLSAACGDCHASSDPHQGKLGQECGQCHTTAGWTPATFDHASTHFPLAGKHAGIPCLQCHADRTFAAASTTCSACHAKDDAHKGRFGTDCAGCHQATAWRDVTFDHSKSSFPLEGKHANVPCTQCHTGPTFAATGSTCSDCHAKDDAHKGQFGTDCGGCHKATAWLDVTFDHSKSAFPLDGQHLTVKCAQCHDKGIFKGTPTACAACHPRPSTHDGNFFTGGCADCHTTAGWKPANLRNHPFPIDHGGTVSECAVCHPTTYATYTCYGCHEHTEAGTRARHLEEGITDLRDCVKCHPGGRGEGGD